MAQNHRHAQEGIRQSGGSLNRGGAAVGGINETIHATQQVLVARVGAQESNMGSLFITTSP